MELSEEACGICTRDAGVTEAMLLAGTAGVVEEEAERETVGCAGACEQSSASA